MLALAGLAYDCMGTNVYVYRIILSLFVSIQRKVTSEGGKSYEDYMRLASASTRRVRSLLMKAQISLEELSRFPTLKVLLSMHAVDLPKAYFVSEPNDSGMVWEEREGIGKRRTEFPSN